MRSEERKMKRRLRRKKYIRYKTVPSGVQIIKSKTIIIPNFVFVRYKTGKKDKIQKTGLKMKNDFTREHKGWVVKTFVSPVGMLLSLIAAMCRKATYKNHSKRQ